MFQCAHGLRIVGLGLLLGSAACSSPAQKTGNPDSSAAGTIRVVIMDAPVPFDAVPITIAEVRIGGDVSPEHDGLGGDENMDSEHGGWTTIVDEVQSFDLLKLQNGVEEALGEGEIPAGSYHQIRLVLTSAAVVVDGQTYDLKVPSGEQTGLKLNYDFEVEADRTYELALDFDAQKSIKKTGNGYLLTPVISVKHFRAVAENVGGATH